MRPNICDICGFDGVTEELLYGPVLSICKKCVSDIARQMLAGSCHMVTYPADWTAGRLWYCSFCAKSDAEVRILVELKPSSHDCICNECIMICIDEVLSRHPRIPAPIMLETIETQSGHNGLP